MDNPYCRALGIEVPDLEVAAMSSDASTYSLLIVALLERGEPMTLEEVAQRFEHAAVALADQALASLKRCRPARAPVYRDGDRYALDPHDDETDLWAFRLGLRPPRVQVPAPEPREPEPLPPPEVALSPAELDAAWRRGIPSGWSAQRVAVAVLDAEGRAMRPEEVLERVAARSERSPLSVESAKYWRRGAAIGVREDGFWDLDRAHDAVRSARVAVRHRIVMERRWERRRPSPEVVRAARAEYERERQKSARALARMRRVLVHAFPAKKPEAVVLLDVQERTLTTLLGDEVAAAGQALGAYDILGAVDVRGQLRALGFEPGERRLAELGPPQKTRRVNRRGKLLRITNTLLVQGSCGISRPFGDPDRLRRYLAEGQHTKLRRRLEADAKSLYALYQFGRLHGAVRLRWGFIDEWLPAPWAHRDEPRLYALKKAALENQLPLEVIAGSAPGWSDPWSRAQRMRVIEDAEGWTWLVASDGAAIDDAEVQAARLVVPERH